MSVTKSQYRSLFAEHINPSYRGSNNHSRSRSSSIARHNVSRKTSSSVSNNASDHSERSMLSTSDKSSPPMYSTAYFQPEPSRNVVRVYPKPEGDRVRSVTIRLRGDCHGEILTTSATFHAYDGLLNQIQSTLLKNFGKGAIGIATPRGKLITEDWQIYQLGFPGASTTFCNVVYSRDDYKSHPPILARASNVLLELGKNDFGYSSSRSGMFMYIDPNLGYDTTYIDQAGLKVIPANEMDYQKEIAIKKGYYYHDMGLPGYDEISLFKYGSACYAADCRCCQGWIRSRRPQTQRSRRQSTRQRPQIPEIQLQDYDGLTLEERRYILFRATKQRR